MIGQSVTADDLTAYILLIDSTNTYDYEVQYIIIRSIYSNTVDGGYIVYKSENSSINDTYAVQCFIQSGNCYLGCSNKYFKAGHTYSYKLLIKK